MGLANAITNNDNLVISLLNLTGQPILCGARRRYEYEEDPGVCDAMERAAQIFMSAGHQNGEDSQNGEGFEKEEGHSGTPALFGKELGSDAGVSVHPHAGGSAWAQIS